MNFSWPHKAAGKGARGRATRVRAVAITAVAAAAAAGVAVPAIAATANAHAPATAKHQAAPATAKHLAAPAAAKQHAAPATAKHSTTTTMSAVTGYVGVKLTLAAQVKGGPTPTGWVEFIYGGKALCSGALSGGKAHCAHAFASAGSFRVEAYYEGTLTHKPSSGTATVRATLRSTATTVTATPAAPFAEQAVTLSAAVKSSTAATGLVTFSDAAGTLCTAKVAGGTASCPYTWEAAGGPFTVTAKYGGDAAHAHSSGTASVTVALNGTTTAITNPFPVTEPAGMDQTVDFTVTDNTPGGPDPTGTVTVTAPAADNPGLMDPGDYTCTNTAPLTPGPDGTSTGSCVIDVVPDDYGFIEVEATYNGVAGVFAASPMSTGEHKFINLMPTDTSVGTADGTDTATAGTVDLVANVIPAPPIPADNILAAGSTTDGPDQDTVTVTVTPTGGGTGGGTCTAVGLEWDGTTMVNYVDCDLTLTAGTYTVTAAFYGDEYAAASTGTATLTVTDGDG